MAGLGYRLNGEILFTTSSVESVNASYFIVAKSDCVINPKLLPETYNELFYTKHIEVYHYYCPDRYNLKLCF